jgi:hypothetical protein
MGPFLLNEKSVPTSNQRKKDFQQMFKNAEKQNQKLI